MRDRISEKLGLLASQLALRPPQLGQVEDRDHHVVGAVRGRHANRGDLHRDPAPVGPQRHRLARPGAGRHDRPQDVTNGARILRMAQRQLAEQLALVDRPDQVDEGPVDEGESKPRVDDEDRRQADADRFVPELERRAGLPPLGDVLDRPAHVDRTAFVVEAHLRLLVDDPLLAVRTDDPVIDAVGLALLERQADLFAHPLPVVGVDQREEGIRIAAERGRGDAEDPVDRPRPPENPGFDRPVPSAETILTARGVAAGPRRVLKVGIAPPGDAGTLRHRVLFLDLMCTRDYGEVSIQVVSPARPSGWAALSRR